MEWQKEIAGVERRPLAAKKNSAEQRTLGIGAMGKWLLWGHWFCLTRNAISCFPGSGSPYARLLSPFNLTARDALQNTDVDGFQFTSLHQSSDRPERNAPLLGELAEAKVHSFHCAHWCLLMLERNWQSIRNYCTISL